MEQSPSDVSTQWNAAIEWFVTKHFPNTEVSEVDVERWPQCGCVRLTVKYHGPDGPCEKQVKFDCGEFAEIVKVHAARQNSTKH